MDVRGKRAGRAKFSPFDQIGHNSLIDLINKTQDRSSLRARMKSPLSFVRRLQRIAAVLQHEILAFFSRKMRFGKILAKILLSQTSMSDTPTFDPAARFVRIVEMRSDGMVDFRFAIGEPQLFVEMLMPKAQFEDFCVQQGVTPTEEKGKEAAVGSSEHEWDWSLRDAREQRLHHQDRNKKTTRGDPPTCKSTCGP
jgi:phenol hydroxylase P0 protein